MKDCKGIPSKVKMSDDCEDARKKWEETLAKSKWCPHVPYPVDKGAKCIEELSLFMKQQEEDRNKAAEEKAKVIMEGIKPYMEGELVAQMPKVSSCSAARKYSDMDIFLAATKGHKIGSCQIMIKDDEFSMCHMYVKAGREREMGNGYPMMNYGGNTWGGDGCVHAEDGPKAHDQVCWYKLKSFELSQDEEYEICTPFGYLNAVNQIKMAIKSGKCC